MAFGFYLFLFANPFNIYEANNLRWIPLLIVMSSMYLSGRINQKTPSKWLPILMMPIVFLKPFNYLYFPFILSVLTAAVSMLVVSRQKPERLHLIVAWPFSIGLLCFYLFSQPLITTQKEFGYGDNGELINAVVWWDFSAGEEMKLPDHLLYNENGDEINLNSLKGGTYLITFWATWCAPCLKKQQSLEQLKSQLQNAEIQFVDISFDIKENEWRRYVDEKELKGIQLISKDAQHTSRKFDFQGIPMYILVEKNGSYKKFRSFEIAEKMIHREVSEEF